MAAHANLTRVEYRLLVPVGYPLWMVQVYSFVLREASDASHVFRETQVTFAGGGWVRQVPRRV